MILLCGAIPAVRKNNIQMAISQETRETIAYDINADKENLFSLAGQILAAAPQRRWGCWVIDSCDSFFLAHFLCETVQLSEGEYTDVPSQVSIANSRSVRSHPNQQMAVWNRLRKPDLNIRGENVLVVTEYHREGVGMSRLVQPVRRIGATSVDAAVLSFDYPPQNRSTNIAHPDKYYIGTPGIYEPRMQAETISRAVGQVSIVGVAEPKDHLDLDMDLRAYTLDAYTALAKEYVASMGS